MSLFTIDPGMTGAILFRNGQSWHPVKMPALKIRKGKGYRSELDLGALANILRPLATGQIGALAPGARVARGQAADAGPILSGAPENRAPRQSGSARAVLGLVERQAPHRGQGFFGGASIMQSYGSIQGILHALAIPFATMDPQSWRKSMKLGPGKERSWLLLGRECPELASMVKSWPLENRIAVADCYGMMVAGQRLGMLTSSDPEPDWLD